MTATNTDVFANIEEVILFAEKELPTILSVAGVFYPPVRAVVPFLPLLQTALDSVKVVQKATGTTTTEATAAVQDTLTPGKPNAPALS